MALIGYAQVSTPDLKLSLQHDALKRAGSDRVFGDQASGARTDRPGLAEALAYLRAGDTLVVWKLDRLGLSMSHRLEKIRELATRGIGCRSLTENIDTTTPVGILMFNIFGSFAQFKRGSKGGRRPVVTPDKLRKARAASRARPRHSIRVILPGTG